MGGRVGYGLNRTVTLYAGAYEADIDVDEFEAFDKVTFGHIDYGVRLHLANSRRRWVPYGDITFTFWPVRDALKNGEKGHHGLQQFVTRQSGGRTRHPSIRVVGS